jgi:hypothetical protein
MTRPHDSISRLHAHSTPDPDPAVTPPPKPPSDPLPADVPPPAHAPVEEPRQPAPLIKA